MAIKRACNSIFDAFLQQLPLSLRIHFEKLCKGIYGDDNWLLYYLKYKFALSSGADEKLDKPNIVLCNIDTSYKIVLICQGKKCALFFSFAGIFEMLIETLYSLFFFAIKLLKFIQINCTRIVKKKYCTRFELSEIFF